MTRLYDINYLIVFRLNCCYVTVNRLYLLLILILLLPIITMGQSINHSINQSTLYSPHSYHQSSYDRCLFLSPHILHICLITSLSYYYHHLVHSLFQHFLLLLYVQTGCRYNGFVTPAISHFINPLTYPRTHLLTRSLQP